MKNNSERKVIIAGGGPAGLFCAYCLAGRGMKVELYEKMDRPGKKYILAGQSRLNITNSGEASLFAEKYGKDRAFFRELLSDFSPADLVKWYRSLGVETFQGSSGKIFAAADSADVILERWIKLLNDSGLFTLHTGCRLTEIRDDKILVFETSEGAEKTVKAEFAVFALGGGSWPKTGSDGRWCGFFRKAGIDVAPLEPANCGFEVKWSNVFRDKNTGLPLKNIRMTYCGESSRGELLITEYGIEGSAVYDLSRAIRHAISVQEKAVITIDLLPDLSVNEIINKLKVPPGGISALNFLRKTLKISGARYSILMELSPEKNISLFIKNNPRGFAEALKNLELELTQPRPIEEAISSAGGVKFEELDKNLMLKKIPGFYVIGEMADWEAPTGGYLLQGCFSTAHRAASALAAGVSLRQNSTDPAPV